jgi:hypothetical protein
MDKSEEYRQKAEHCQHMADAARLEVDKEQWLLLAQSWRQMIVRHDGP